MKLFGQSTSTRAALAPRFAGIALAMLAMLTGNRWLMLLACACGGVLIVALVLRPRITALTVQVTMPLRTSAGAHVDCLVEVDNPSNEWSSVVHCTHHVDGLDDITCRVDALPPGESASLTFTRAAHTRGVATTSSAELTTTAPLGMRLRKRTVVVPLRVIVHPAEVPVVVPPARAIADNTDWIVSREGVDVHGVREWRAGDDATQVHWRSSARRGRLIVLERELPKPGGFALALAASPGDHEWERVVSVGAWTCVAAIRAGRNVVLVSTLSDGTVAGPDDPTTILDWCAQSQPALPREQQLRDAFQFAGRGGEIAVAAGESAMAGWWQWAASMAATDDVALMRLPLDDLGQLGIAR